MRKKRGSYYTHVIDDQGRKIVIEEHVERRTAFRTAEDILATGLVMNGREIHIEGVHTGRHR
jgi:hypothetical protein